MSTEAILMGLIGLICAVAFTALGVHAFLAKKPVSFWAGSKIDPEQVTDIAAYNRANGKMWLLYSIPFWIAGIAGACNDLSPAASYIFLIVLILAGSVGLIWVLLHYQKIADNYIKK